MMFLDKPVSKHFSLAEVKAGENLNRPGLIGIAFNGVNRNTLSVLRIKIFSNAEIGQNGSF